jgi:hypothetical protein
MESDRTRGRGGVEQTLTKGDHKPVQRPGEVQTCQREPSGHPIAPREGLRTANAHAGPPVGAAACACARATCGMLVVRPRGYGLNAGFFFIFFFFYNF